METRQIEENLCVGRKEEEKEGRNAAIQLQQLFVKSDAYYDPEAFILAPDNVIKISSEIVKGTNYIDSTKRGCLTALGLISEAIEDRNLMHDAKEDDWMNILSEDISAIPTDESAFVEMIMPTLDSSKLILSEYGL